MLLTNPPFLPYVFPHIPLPRKKNQPPWRDQLLDVYNFNGTLWLVNRVSRTLQIKIMAMISISAGLQRRRIKMRSRRRRVQRSRGEAPNRSGTERPRLERRRSSTAPFCRTNLLGRTDSPMTQTALRTISRREGTWCRRRSRLRRKNPVATWDEIFCPF